VRVVSWDACEALVTTWPVSQAASSSAKPVGPIVGLDAPRRGEMDQIRKAKKIVPSHLLGTDDPEAAWKQHRESRRADEAARSDLRAACDEESATCADDIPIKADGFSFIGDCYFEGHGWGVRSR